MTVEEIIDGVLAREGGWRGETPRPNAPPDPATNRGITLPTLRTYRAKYLGTPESETTLASLRALTDLEAREIYAVLFVQEPQFTQDNIPFEPLRVQLIDFGVNSSPARAVRWLQRCFMSDQVPVTGAMDAELIKALHLFHDFEALHLVNDALVAARSYMIDQAVDQGRIRKADEEGVESRALSFFLARP